ncbi:MAG TPA: hypothetical protein VH599_06265 [Ktedonobacterales bacterium]|jgi:hypothetical protein
MVSKRHLFRAQALQEYTQRREKEILPRLVRPPVLLCCWVLLGLLLAATVLAWQAQVAVSVEAAGAIVQDAQIAPQDAGQTAALLFVPAAPSLHLPVGQTITVYLTGQAEPLSATIESVAPDVLSPDEARQRYGLAGDLAWVITQPSMVVTLALHTNLSAPVLTGRSVHTQIPVGSQSLLTLLPKMLQELL